MDDGDVLRGLTLYESVPAAEEAGERTVEVELCPGAHVYALRLCATLNDPALLDTWNQDVPLATLHLQDSEIRVYVGCCTHASDYPGVRWPAYARLTVAAGARAVLSLDYGHCA